MPYYVYILYSPSFDQFYKGISNNPQRRLKEHNNREEKSTSPYIPWHSVCVIEKENRSEAMILEKKLKNMNRNKLERFIEKYGGQDVHEVQS